MTLLQKTANQANLVSQEGARLTNQSEVQHTIRLLNLRLILHNLTSNSSQISGLNPLLILRLKWAQ